MAPQYQPPGVRTPVRLIAGDGYTLLTADLRPEIRLRQDHAPRAGDDGPVMRVRAEVDVYGPLARLLRDAADSIDPPAPQPPEGPAK